MIIILLNKCILSVEDKIDNCKDKKPAEDQ